jgi:integrase
MNNAPVLHKKSPELSLIATKRGDCYDGHIKQFVNYCIEHDEGVTEESITGFFTHLNDEFKQGVYTASTVSNKRFAVKNRVRKLMDNAPIDTQIRLDRVFRNLDRSGVTRAPKMNDTAVHADKILSPLEMERLIAAASKPIALCIKFLYATGCRVSEMTGIKKGEPTCKRQGELVSIRVIGKGMKQRDVLITTDLYEAISNHFRGELYLFETSGGQELSRQYVTASIAKYAKKVLQRRISAHSMRHSFITHMLRRGAMIDALSRYVGHSSPAITLAMYCHNEMDNELIIEHMKEILS